MFKKKMEGKKIKAESISRIYNSIADFKKNLQLDKTEMN